MHEGNFSLYADNFLLKILLKQKLARRTEFFTLRVNQASSVAIWPQLDFRQLCPSSQCITAAMGSC